MATTTTAIYTLSLHDALPIWIQPQLQSRGEQRGRIDVGVAVNLAEAHELGAFQAGDKAHDPGLLAEDRKSTRLNSSHRCISYAVFCLKKKTEKKDKKSKEIRR